MGYTGEGKDRNVWKGRLGVTEIDPIVSNDLTTKKYVDDEIDAKIEDGTATGQMSFWNGTKWVKTETSELFWDDTNKLLYAKDIDLTNTTHANEFGIIYKNSNRFIHDFNYGDNETVTTLGGNLFMGEDSGNFSIGSTATFTFHGSNNTGVGNETLNDCTTGYLNLAIGGDSLKSLTTGYSNTGLGAQTLDACTIGFNNVAIGQGALGALTSGDSNTALGQNCLNAITTADDNIGIGFGAGALISGFPSPSFNTTGYNSIFIGNSTKPLANGQFNQIVIGNGLKGKGSNTVSLGDDSIIQTYLKGDVGIDKTPTCKMDVDGAIASGSSSFSTTGPTDNVDVSAVNTLLIDASSNSVTIGGFSGGVAGQILHIVRCCASAHDVTLEHNEGGGSQDIFLHVGADETLFTEYGGWVLVCNGSDWFDCSHAKHV